MSISKYRKIKIEALEEKAFDLYKTGITLMEVGKIVGMSYGWVFNAVKKQEKREENKNLTNI